MSASLKRALIYGALALWTVVALFPIFWTFSTTFKVAKDVQLGNIVPWLQYKPGWLGLRAIGLSPDTIFEISTPRAEFIKRFWNSIIASVGGASLALVLGATAAYGLSRFQYRYKIWKNADSGPLADSPVITRERSAPCIDAGGLTPQSRSRVGAKSTCEKSASERRPAGTFAG